MSALTLPANIGKADAKAALHSLKTQIKQSAKANALGIVLDASALQSFDSSSLALLLECRRQAQALGRTLRVQNAPAKLRQLANLYGVNDLLPTSA